MKLVSHEMGGFVEVLTVNQNEDGTWEAPWEPLRGTVFADQFTTTTKEVIDHALHGLSRPLTDALGIPPAGALRKLPKAARECFQRQGCVFYEPKKCLIGAKHRPWCFEPDEIADEDVRKAATKAIEAWEQGVYVVVVTG